MLHVFLSVPSFHEYFIRTSVPSHLVQLTWQRGNKFLVKNESLRFTKLLRLTFIIQCISTKTCALQVVIFSRNCLLIYFKSKKDNGEYQVYLIHLFFNVFLLLIPTLQFLLLKKSPPHYVSLSAPSYLTLLPFLSLSSLFFFLFF